MIDYRTSCRTHRPNIPPRHATTRPADPVQGRAMCDEVEPVPKDDLVDHPGGGAMLSRRTMGRIDHALRIVLDL